VELPLETCRAVYRNIINCTQSHLVGQLLTLLPVLLQKHILPKLLLGYGLRFGLKVATGFVYNLRACNYGGSFTFLTQKIEL